MSRTWANGSTPQWRRTRAQVLARDHHTCRIQLPGICTHQATHVHHTKGRAVTGDDPNHLIAACPPCNLAIGNPLDQRHDPPTTGTRSNW